MVIPEKRPRKQTQRFGQNSGSVNKDHYFDRDNEIDLTENSSIESLESPNLTTNASISPPKSPNELSDALTKENSFETDGSDEFVSNDFSMEPNEHSKGGKTGKKTLKTNESQKTTSDGLERQVCRLEVKVGQILSTLSQLHRAVVSSSIGVNAVPGPEQFPELPLVTEESMDKFENDLCENDSYRKKVVSVTFFF